MSSSVVNDVQIEVRRLAVAGSDIAIGDGRVKRLSLDVRKMGETVPMFARLADPIELLANPGAGSPVGNLLEAATLTNALLYTQGAVGVEGELIVPESRGPDLPLTASYRTISRVKEAMEERGSRRLRLFEKVCEGGGFVDLRLLDTFIGLLYSPSSDVADLVCGEILPAYGEAVLPQLLSGYNVKGRVGDGRRLELIARVMKEEGEGMYLDALKHGSESLKVSALRCMRYVPESTEIIIEYSRSGVVGAGSIIQSEAFKMLAEINSEAAADRIIEASRNYEELYDVSDSVGSVSNDLMSEVLVRKLVQEGNSCLACYQQKKVDQEIDRRFDVILHILRRSDSPGVREFFERCKGQPECLARIVWLVEDRVDVEDPDDRKRLFSVLRSIVHSSGEHGARGLFDVTCLTDYAAMENLRKLICLAAHAAILEDDRETIDMIAKFASDPSSPIYDGFTSTIYHYTDRQLSKKTDFLVTRRLFEMAMDIVTPHMPLFCNALLVMRKDHTGLPVDREMNEKFLGKCLPHGHITPKIYCNAAYLYVEMDEYDKALECVGLLKKHDYWGYEGMMEQIRTLPIFDDFRKDERVRKIIEG
ncbi:MAG TPA: hypothetical protein VK436_03775 [Methanocella sp.]|nr:hypothetical protein [Methanocella sp.]